MLVRGMFRLVCALAVIMVPLARPASGSDEEVSRAVKKSIPLLQSTNKFWVEKMTCVSCHHSILPVMVLKRAREKGIPLDEKLAGKAIRETFAFLGDLDRAVQGSHMIDTVDDAHKLVAAHEAGVPANLSTAVYARALANLQMPEGRWLTIDCRPPQSHGPFIVTAVSLRALALYMPPQLQSEARERIERAKSWLLSAKPRTTEDQAFRLLGLFWAGAEAKHIAEARDRMIGAQRTDGGWAQIESRSSDAYATGEVLVALREAGGVSPEHPAYQRGIRFLTDSQRPDGSWLVETRLHPPAPVSPPFVDTGFPHGKNQFIACMATSWATMALLDDLPAKHSSEPLASGMSWPKPETWIEKGLFGSAPELGRLLDSGLDPNSKTAAGTSVLMLSASDLEKVKLLVEPKADVIARSKSGFNALMVASRYRGNAETARFIIERGADVKTLAGRKVLFDASPLFLAAMGGDPGTVGLLLEKGADLHQEMMLLGIFPASPLNIATIQGNTPMVECLIRKGADANEQDRDGITPLGWSAITDYSEQARRLIALGADVNHLDKFGMTPLLYAANIDFGNTEMVEILLSAGAKPEARNREAKSALELARQFNHLGIARILELALSKN